MRESLGREENVGFDLAKSDLCPSFIEDHVAKGMGIRVVDFHTGKIIRDDVAGNVPHFERDMCVKEFLALKYCMCSRESHKFTYFFLHNEFMHVTAHQIHQTLLLKKNSEMTGLKENIQGVNHLTKANGVGDEEVVVGEGVVVTSSSLEMLTNSCPGGIMTENIFPDNFFQRLQGWHNFTSENLIFMNINFFLMTDATDLTFSINSNRQNDVIKRRRVGLIWTIRRDTNATSSIDHLSVKTQAPSQGKSSSHFLSMDAKFIIGSQTCTLTKDELSQLVADYDIPQILESFFQKELKPFFMPLLGYVGLYTHLFTLSNLRIPLPKFFCEVLNYFKVHILRFNPFGLAKLTTFFVMCKAYGGEPNVNLHQDFLNLGHA
nr:hypothetical protein [Tanacetum cinerariifolium]